jgi:hypothetical protein
MSHSTSEVQHVGREASFEPPEPPDFVREEHEDPGSKTPVPRRARPMEDEPSALVARYLFPTERFQGEWRRHWVRPAAMLVITGEATILASSAAHSLVKPDSVTALVMVIVVAGVLSTVSILLRWYYGRFVLTSKRVILVEGVVRRRVSSMALLQITDLRFETDLLGRILNYGTFVIEGARLRSRLRRVSELPAPNELYLRIVEELYEPEAVETRLGRYADHADYTDHSVWLPSAESIDVGRAETLSLAIREALYGPPLVNYNGWVNVAVFDDDGRSVSVSADRRVRIVSNRAYELRVMIAPNQLTKVAEPLVVTEGVARDLVEFTAEVDSDRPALRRSGERITVDRDKDGLARFVIRADDGTFEEPPWLWIRVSQNRRLLQSIELTVTFVPAEEV